MRKKCFSFAPIATPDAQVLLLGSMPSEASLEKGEYYGNPRNQFWKLIYALFDEKVEEEYSKRIQFLQKKRIALWDVIATCTREGSADASIQEEVPNDLIGFLKAHPDIRFIGFNGTKAFQTFKKRIGIDAIKGIDWCQLPSSSPAHAVPFERKWEEWRVIKRYIHAPA